MPTLNQEQITGLNAANQRVTQGLGTAEEIARDQQNINYATQTYGWTPQTFNAATPSQPGGANLATAVAGYQGPGGTLGSGQTPFEQGTGIEGYDAAMAAEAKSKETDWMQDWMKSAFGEQKAADQIKAPTFDAEKARLQTARDNRLAALDAQYATDLATVQKNNKNIGNSLKARLLKLGVSPSDSAWSNAEAGQLERDTAAEAKLRSEYMSNKAKIESDVDSQLTTLAMNEATMNFNATVKNIENKLATQAQGINLYQIFASRDQSEKDREQRAYSALMDYEAKMLTLDQNQQEAIARNLIDNAQKGLYNISDKATLEMLTNLEKQSPYLSGLTNIASAGLTDRLDKKAQDKLNMEKITWDINNIKSQIAERNKPKSGDTTGLKKLSILNQMAGFIDQRIHTSVDANGNMSSTKNPRSLTNAEYQKARQAAVLEGLSGSDFDEAFSSALGNNRYTTPTTENDSGSYIDQATGKLVNIKIPY